MAIHRRWFRALALTAGWIALTNLGNAAPSAAPDSENKAAASFVRIETANFPWENIQPGAEQKFSAEEIESTRRELERTRNKLRQTILPEVIFRDITVREALRFLSKETGIPIVDMSGIPPGLSQPVLENNAIELGVAHITLSLKNVSAEETLRYVTTLAGVREKIEPGAVIVKPIFCYAQGLESRSFKAHAVVGGSPIKDFLESKGVQFPQGSILSYNRSEESLIVRNTEDNLIDIEIILEELAGQPRHIRTEQEIAEEREFRKTLKWKQSLEKTVVLKAEIRDAPLEMIIRVLQTKVSPWIAVSGESKVRISLSMKDTSVAELLSQVAARTKTRLVIGLEGIVFIPEAEAKP